MAKITFIQPDGASQTVEAEEGLTVMEAAKLARQAAAEQVRLLEAPGAAGTSTITPTS